MSKPSAGGGQTPGPCRGRNGLQTRNRDDIVIGEGVAPVEHHDLVARLIFPNLGSHLDHRPAALVADPERQRDLLGNISAVHRLVGAADAREVPLDQHLFRPHGQLPLGKHDLPRGFQLSGSRLHGAPWILPAHARAQPGKCDRSGRCARTEARTSQPTQSGPFRSSRKGPGIARECCRRHTAADLAGIMLFLAQVNGPTAAKMTAIGRTLLCARTTSMGLRGIYPTRMQSPARTAGGARRS